jgi:hypothetical protein
VRQQQIIQRLSMSLALAVGACALLPVPAAHAAPNPIAADADKDWLHHLTGVAFPARIGEFARKDIGDYSNQQLDIIATYEQPATKTTATLYLYRAGLPDASVWHDRILKVIGTGRLGAEDPAGLHTTLFTPPGQAADSGIRSVVPLSGKAYTASGLAVFPHDDWLVAVRMSSETGTAGDLDHMLAGFVDGLRLAPASHRAPVAYAITPCAQPFPTQSAARAARDMSGGLLASLLMQAVDNDKVKAGKGKTKADKAKAEQAQDTPDPHYCSGPPSEVTYGIYRNALDPKSYLVALGDGGNVVWVTPDSMAAILDPKKSGQYAMTLSTVAQRISYTPFTAQPSPAQVVDALRSEKPVSATNRPIGKATDRTITLSPD